MATQQQVIQPPKTNTLEVTSAETSSRVTARILAWSISEILKERHVFPADAFQSTDLGDENTVVALQRQNLKGEFEDYQEAVNRLLDMLSKVFKGIFAHQVTAIILQFHDGQDMNKLYEEWRFELEHRDDDQLKQMTAKVAGSRGVPDLDKTLDFGSQKFVKPKLSDSEVSQMASRTIGMIRDAMKTVKPIDFENNDIRLGLTVHYTKEAYLKGDIPPHFDIQEDTSVKRHIDNPKRFKVSSADLKYNAVSIKMKTSLYRGRSAKGKKESVL
ncbi:uncharacterized protein LOC129584706 [Paramacrobiotus metropolitanus]|uniref:uncharacterized protein LOC129584706 n=1 Tax=Paramacrobiotus metropolitanus TaxID=2943436 RepID=UPI002445A837|nr:uncharacterized protein LOC129584706 [Paramacrobiotus metropolitanus]